MMRLPLPFNIIIVLKKRDCDENVTIRQNNFLNFLSLSIINILECFEGKKKMYHQNS